MASVARLIDQRSNYLIRTLMLRGKITMSVALSATQSAILQAALVWDHVFSLAVIGTSAAALTPAQLLSKHDANLHTLHNLLILLDHDDDKDLFAAPCRQNWGTCPSQTGDIPHLAKLHASFLIEAGVARLTDQSRSCLICSSIVRDRGTIRALFQVTSLSLKARRS